MLLLQGNSALPQGGIDTASEDDAASADGANSELEQTRPEDDVVNKTADQLEAALTNTITEVLPEPVQNSLNSLDDIQVGGGVTLLGVLGALVILIVVNFVRMGLIRILDRYLKPMAEKTATKHDDIALKLLRRGVNQMIMIGGLFLAVAYLRLPQEPTDIREFVYRVLYTLLIVVASLIIYRIVQFVLGLMSQGREERGQTSLLDAQFLPLISDIAKITLIVLALLTIVKSWGGDVTGLLAGVGITGLALAFAAQDTVANIFGSFVIYSDRPFAVGDWVILNGVEGTVEEIGIRSTRIRKFDKTMVSVPNKIVANENIQNFSAMPIRRIKLYIGVYYEASPEQMRDCVERMRRMLADNKGIDQSFWMVNFTEMNSSSLDILLYAFTSTTAWQEYMDIRQDILCQIMAICDDVGVEIAFPTQTVYHRNGLPDGSGLPLEFVRGSTRDMPDERAHEIASPKRPPAKPQGGKQQMEWDSAEGEGDG